MPEIPQSALTQPAYQVRLIMDLKAVLEKVGDGSLRATWHDGVVSMLSGCNAPTNCDSVQPFGATSPACRSPVTPSEAWRLSRSVGSGRS